MINIIEGFRVVRTRILHKGPKDIKCRGQKMRVQESDEARRRGTRDDHEAHRTTERDTNLTQVQGPREEVKPLLLPSCIALRWLEWCTRS
jgi:hypothetical protein